MRTPISLTYDDVLLVPQYSDIKSRSEIDIDTVIGGRYSRPIHLKIPILSSPMDTVTGANMATTMNKAGGMGIIHRYCTVDQQAEMVSKINAGTKAAAIGITGDFHDRAKVLVALGVGVLCVDVAHGHHALMEGALKQLRDTFGDSTHIMAGNVATLEGVNALSDWGADSVRCNIGGGSICSTRIQTGHGHPGLQTIIDCSKTDRDVTIIADGGIRNSGDIVKALAVGADCVMVGSLLSGTTEAPGEIIYINGDPHKNYRGMASEEAQRDWRGSASSLEGISTVLSCKGPVQNVIHELERGVRSGFSYSGARSLTELQSKAVFTRQTAAGIRESNTHILGLK
jgi:IMP dehydrogenase